MGILRSRVEKKNYLSMMYVDSEWLEIRLFCK